MLDYQKIYAKISDCVYIAVTSNFDNLEITFANAKEPKKLIFTSLKDQLNLIQLLNDYASVRNCNSRISCTKLG